MHTETEYNTLQRELQHAREKLALYEGTSRAAGQASRILGVAGGLLLFGPGLSKALLNLGRSWSSTSGPSIEAVLGVAAAIVRRISWGLILGALCAALPLVLLIQQNTLISTQNELIAQQNQLSEASRRAGLMFELTSILDKIDKEMDAANIEKAAMNVKERHTQNYKDEEHRRRANRRSIQPQEREKYQFSERLSGRIVALSRSLNPYRFLERDGRTTPRPLSPERGQLLLSLLETGADLEELNHAQGLTFADADLRNISLLNAVLIHVKLERANFQGADLTGIRFQYGRLDGADFSNARLDSAKFRCRSRRRALLSGQPKSGIIRRGFYQEC